MLKIEKSHLDSDIIKIKIKNIIYYYNIKTEHIITVRNFIGR